KGPLPWGRHPLIWRFTCAVGCADPELRGPGDRAVDTLGGDVATFPRPTTLPCPRPRRSGSGTARGGQPADPPMATHRRRRRSHPAGPRRPRPPPPPPTRPRPRLHPHPPHHHQPRPPPAVRTAGTGLGTPAGG